MKKLFLCTAIAVFGLSKVNAQFDANLDSTTLTTDETVLEENDATDNFTGISQGDWLLTASLRYSSDKFGDDKSNGFTVMPQATHMFTDNVGAGAGITYMSSKSEFNGNTSSETTTFGAGIHGYYFCNPQNRFTTYTGLNIGILSEKDKVNDVKENGFEAGLSVGALFNLNECWALKTHIGALNYSTLKEDTSGAESRNEFGLDFDLKNIWFGAVYKF
ncbi:outer membrane beta-barrel protein [Algibacter sp. 2305UL17-15]|uniref:outer membrane beta-barrel protein n=1 Tax=Algibacter sp. 2305UL17-15 TaxID=3231268 RepID=UPI00345AB508